MNSSYNKNATKNKMNHKLDKIQFKTTVQKSNI